MNTRASHHRRGRAITLAAACVVMACGFVSCGGSAGDPPADPVSAPGVSISSTSVVFNSQAIGTTSAPQSATLTNVGNASLTLSSVQVTGPNAADFSLSNGCGSSLAPSIQCTVSLTFTPSAAGTRTASVAFNDNANGSPQTISLTGTGASAGVGLSATTLTFGSQLVETSAAAQTVTLTNNGNAALSITGIAVAGANPGDFPETNTCGTSIAAGGAARSR